MTELRSLTVERPAGDWGAVSLQEGPSADGPWQCVQAMSAKDAQSPMTITFRPRLPGGYYKPVWVPVGGTRAGLVEGDVVRLEDAAAALSGQASFVERVPVADGRVDVTGRCLPGGRLWDDRGRNVAGSVAGDGTVELAEPTRRRIFWDGWVEEAAT